MTPSYEAAREGMDASVEKLKCFVSSGPGWEELNIESEKLFITIRAMLEQALIDGQKLGKAEVWGHVVEAAASGGCLVTFEHPDPKLPTLRRLSKKMVEQLIAAADRK